MIKWHAKNPGRQHAANIKRRYGLTIERYNELLTQQGCKCALCGKQHDPSVKLGRLYVDHCHKDAAVCSGKATKVRALLCNSCNSALGYFNENIEVMQKAIDYLKKHK